MKKLLLSLFVLPLISMELQRIDDHNIMKLSGTRNSELYRDMQGFQVNQDGQFKRIPSHRLTQAVRELKNNPEALDYFLKNKGYLKLTKNQDDEYALDADGRLDGGFLLTGVIVYQSCRVIGYTGLVLGSAGTIIAATAGGGPVAGFVAAGQVIQASAPASAAIETGSLAIGTAASWIPWLP